MIDSVSCDICGDKEFKLLCQKSGFRYVSCACCGSVRQYPYPIDQDIARYYADYQTKKSSNSEYLTEAGYACFKRDKLFTFSDLEIAKDCFSDKSLLDVGCGTGHFVSMMKDFSTASVQGIDISSECIAYAQKQNLNCFCGDFLGIEGHYDVISMWHLIEHLRHPRSYIEHAYRLLPPGGWLLIETPLLASYPITLARIGGFSCQSNTSTY